MSDDTETTTGRRPATPGGRPSADGALAEGLLRDVAFLEGLLAGTAGVGGGAGRSRGASDEDVAAALGVFEGMRTALDRLEAHVVIEARRRGMEWREIAGHQGMKSSQAASQRYQRLVTRLEEIRQGIR
ncbi:hypothetical protein [Streptomyces sp. NRRL F-4474]|uniref:hypothetical protein n=1 Tax=Streptomyces sp. NRRL F-4474 TaxID=1463851 RepID=UPI0004CAD665|nr:hypothetical protein [Streptomyces sp. NRRL F-4474]